MDPVQELRDQLMVEYCEPPPADDVLELTASSVDVSDLMQFILKDTAPTPPELRPTIPLIDLEEEKPKDVEKEKHPSPPRKIPKLDVQPRAKREQKKRQHPQDLPQEKKTAAQRKPSKSYYTTTEHKAPPQHHPQDEQEYLTKVYRMSGRINRVENPPMEEVSIMMRIKSCCDEKVTMMRNFTI